MQTLILKTYYWTLCYWTVAIKQFATENTKKLTHVPETFTCNGGLFSISSSLPLTLHNSLTSSNWLFFIWYLPQNTLKACWFLVQINHVKTALLHMNSKRTDVITAKQHIALSHWEYFLTVCNTLSIFPPFFLFSQNAFFTLLETFSSRIPTEEEKVSSTTMH